MATNEKTQAEIDKALARDYYDNDRKAWAEMPESRRMIVRQAIADEEAANQAKPDDFEKKVQSMDDAAFARFKQDLNWEAAKKGNI